MHGFHLVKKDCSASLAVGAQEMCVDFCWLEAALANRQVLVRHRQVPGIQYVHGRDATDAVLCRLRSGTTGVP